MYTYLVGGVFPLPLWKMMVCEFGKVGMTWHSQLHGKIKCSKPPTSDYRTRVYGGYSYWHKTGLTSTIQLITGRLHLVPGVIKHGNIMPQKIDILWFKSYYSYTNGKKTMEIVSHRWNVTLNLPCLNCETKKESLFISVHHTFLQEMGNMCSFCIILYQPCY